ncbi:flagellar motor switch protein FliN [uncultured Desulfovibrio sp.]|uniref:flagellar motor switch protein FliN n=1 Tax=uncultured Desulfovibrio sp. TaxID=167968 RepID=UPI0026161E07|nr:flagellar motor switch protein FliN [uncultured Desulfovibrio sp.]
MSQDDQEALAAQWAEQLGEEDSPSDGGAGGEQSSADDEALAAQWAAALADDEEEKSGPSTFGGAGSGSFGQAPTDAQFRDMTETARQPKDSKLKRELDFILDIPLDVSAELGRTRLLINELLQLGQGSVVELNKLAGEPLEVYVNGKLVARGEAVVINEKFGVRLTDIISPIERVKQLG